MVGVCGAGRAGREDGTFVEVWKSDVVMVSRQPLGHEKTWQGLRVLRRERGKGLSQTWLLPVL